MKVGDVVMIRYITENRKEDRGKIGIVIKHSKAPYRSPGYVCTLKTSTQILKYHEGRLEAINELH